MQRVECSSPYAVHFHRIVRTYTRTVYGLRTEPRVISDTGITSTTETRPDLEEDGWRTGPTPAPSWRAWSWVRVTGPVDGTQLGHSDLIASVFLKLRPRSLHENRSIQNRFTRDVDVEEYSVESIQDEADIAGLSGHVRTGFCERPDIE